jgi:GNAT superfamily N-acetyltransferase
MGVEIQEVETGRALRCFVRLPWTIYHPTDPWVPPLLSDQKKQFSPSHHPFYHHAEVKLYLALIEGEPAGRIAAIINRNHNEFHKDRVGFFGFFETVENREVAHRLLEAAAKFLRDRGMEVMRGPMSFSTNEQCGLLVEGFELAPYIMMPYNQAYYGEMLESFGCRKAKDLYAYYLSPQIYEQRINVLAKRVATRLRIALRPVNLRHFQEEINVIRGIYNSAWERNWGFVPMTDEEFSYVAHDLKKIVNPRFVIIGEIEGKAIGFALALPNWNIVLKRLNGRMFPLGILKALWYQRKIRQVRIITMGVLKEYRGKGIDILFYHKLFETGQELGPYEGEMSWILEDNEMMNRALEDLGAKLYKRYRIYDYPLDKKASGALSERGSD